MIPRRELGKRQIFVPMPPFTSSQDDEVWGLDYPSSGDETKDIESETDEVHVSNEGSDYAPGFHHSITTQPMNDSDMQGAYCQSASEFRNQRNHSIHPEPKELSVSAASSETMDNIATGIGGFQRRAGQLTPEHILEPISHALARGEVASTSFILPPSELSGATPSNDHEFAVPDSNEPLPYDQYTLESPSDTNRRDFGTSPTRVPSASIVNTDGTIHLPADIGSTLLRRATS